MSVTKRKSRILEEMHETARGLHTAELIDKRRMCEFDALCHLDVNENRRKASRHSGSGSASVRLYLRPF